MLALDHSTNDICDGIVLWAARDDYDRVLAKIRERELVTSAYREEVVEVELRGGGKSEAIAYVVDQHHRQYCGGLPPVAQAKIIFRARGISGDNRDYLRQTVRRFDELGISDPGLLEVERLVSEISDPPAAR